MPPVAIAANVCVDHRQRCARLRAMILRTRNDKTCQLVEIWSARRSRHGGVKIPAHWARPPSRNFLAQDFGRGREGAPVGVR